jgi:hypothetical protein
MDIAIGDCLAVGDTGCVMDTIERLRAELGDRVLALAATDPVLDRAVNLYADGIAAILRERATIDGRGPNAADSSGVDLPELVWYAGRIEAAEREWERTALAGGHLARSLIAAAICRLADRLATAAGQPAHQSVH